MKGELFEIARTAVAARIGVAALKNMLRQGVIKYCGDEPRPSYPRMFPRAGVYEIALLWELMQGGFDRAFSSRLVRRELDQWQASLVGAEPLRGCWKITQRVFEKYRDLTKPCIWVFAGDSSSWEAVPTVEYSNGYEDVPAQVNRLQKVGKPYLLSVNKPNVTKPGAPLNVIGMLNVTAVLVRVDESLESGK